MKRLLFTLLFLALTSLANVDMVMGDAAQNELIIAWSRNNSAFLGKYSGEAYTHVVEQSDLNTAAVTLALDDSFGPHVLFLPYVQGENGDYAHLLSYNYDDLAYESSFQVENMAMNDRFGLLKAPDARWDALLAYSNIAFTSTSAGILVQEISLDIATDGELIFKDMASWERFIYYRDGGYSEYPSSMVGPVICPGGYPLVAVS